MQARRANRCGAFECALHCSQSTEARAYWVHKGRVLPLNVLVQKERKPKARKLPGAPGGDEDGGRVDGSVENARIVVDEGQRLAQLQQAVLLL